MKVTSKQRSEINTAWAKLIAGNKLTELTNDEKRRIHEFTMATEKHTRVQRNSKVGKQKAGHDRATDTKTLSLFR